MSLDHLLLWLSAREAGSWSLFRGAVDRLYVEENDESPDSDYEGDRTATSSPDLPVYQRVCLALQRLGHVEFFSNEADQRRWRVVPPAIALFPNNPGEGVLCGARSTALLERLDHLDDIEVIRTEKSGMPQRLHVSGAYLAMASAARYLGCLIQMDAATAILSGVPGVRDPVARFRTEIPETSGWTVHRFSASKLRWVSATNKDAVAAQTDLFKFVMKHQRAYYLRWNGCSYSVPVQVGKYAVMRQRRGILAYDIEAKALSVPAICRPPLLIERALVLCSGFLPRFDPASHRVKYAGVPPDIARLAAQLLRQEIR